MKKFLLITAMFSLLAITGWNSLDKTIAAVTPVLDNVSSQPYFAYSLRQLKSTYTGPAIQVRRSSDNATSNIGFDSNGNLDTAALTTFCGANSCFVSIWYDQSGNNLNQSQATIARQPMIVNAGNIVTFNGKPAINFASASLQYLTYIQTPGTSFLSTTTGNTVVGVFNTGPRSGAVGGALISESSTALNNPTVEWIAAYNGFAGTNNNWLFFRNDNAANFTDWTTTALAHNSLNNHYVLSLSTTTATQDWRDYLNGTAVATNTSSASITGPFTFTNLSVGAYVRASVNQYYNGTTTELIGFKSVLSSSDRSSLTYNQSEYYLIGSAPDVPSNLSASTSNHSASLSWTAPVQNGLFALSDYVIEYKQTSSGTWNIFNDGLSTSTVASVTGLATGTSYDFRVSAVNVIGTGTPSSIYTATTTSVVVVPNSPTYLVAGSLNSRALIAWMPVSSASGYVLDYKQQSSSSWNSINISYTTSTQAYGYELTGLTNGTTYDIRLSSYNAAGTSTPTSIVNVIPSPVQGSSFSNLFLSTGQSLSVGISGGNALTLTQPYNNKMLQATNPSSFNWYNNIALAPTLTLADFTGLTALKEPNTQVGNSSLETPASAMGNVLSDLASSSSRTFDSIFVLNGIGSQTYNSLKKGTLPYSNGLLEARAAMNYSVQSGKPYIVQGVTIIHGETDETNLNTGYETNLVQWQSDYETDLKSITGQSQDIPVFLNQMSSWPQRGHSVPTTALAQLSATRNYPTKFYLTTPLYIFNSPEGVHLYNWGYRRLGEYFGKVMKKVLVDGVAWKPTMPVSETISGNIIEARYNVPVAPLVFDTTAVATATNYGFEYSDSLSSASITNVEIVGGDTVRITLNQTPTGSNQKLRYAYTSSGTGNGYSMNPQSTSTVRGNLRDSDVTPSKYQDSNVPSWAGNYLRNWSVTFNDSIVSGPSQPQNLQSSPVNNSQISLSWTAPANNGGSAITNYIVEYKKSSDATWTTFSSSSSALSASVTGLMASTTYDFRVRANNSGGITGITGTSSTSTLSAMYTISYNSNGANGGSVPVDSNNYATNATATTLTNSGNLFKNNYIFNGWNTLANGTGVHYATSSSVVIGTSSLILYAEWLPVTISGGVVTGGGTGGAIYTYIPDGKGGYYTVYPGTDKIVYSSGGMNSSTSSLSNSDSKINKYIFKRNLKLGSRGEDVRQLQIALNKLGYTVSEKGSGSVGFETSYFGISTKNALMKFQAKYLDPGYTTGNFFELSRAKINSF